MTGGVDTNIHVYHAPSYSKIVSLKGHQDWIRSLSIMINCVIPQSPADPQLGDILIASSSQDKYIRVWKIAQQKVSVSVSDFEALCEQLETLSTRPQNFQFENRTFEFSFDALLMGHDDWVHSVAWRTTIETGGNALISASADKTVMCWEVDASTRIWVNTVRVGDVGGDTLGFYYALFTRDEIIASAYNGSIHVWKKSIKLHNSALLSYVPRIGILRISLHSHQGTTGHSGRVEDCCWSPNGEFFATVSEDKSMRIFAFFNGLWNEIARPMTHGHPIKTVAFFAKYGFVSGSDEKVSASEKDS